MADLSNKALALLLLVAIVVSVGGTAFTLQRMGQLQGVTGMATSSPITGKTNFSIDSSLSIRFVNSLVLFGSGYVNGSMTSCSMGTNNTPPLGTRGCINFNTTVHTSNLTIENDGNVLANVSLNFTRNATTFIGGTSPSFKYEVGNNESSSCTTLRNASTFKEVSDIEVNGTNARICDGLNFDDESDRLHIGFWLVIPEDASVGSHEVTVTAIACDDSSC